MGKMIFFIVLVLLLTACASIENVATKAYLENGKNYFEAGYYKRAMKDLLPLACDGNKEAQYAVGYMYYYGYGVTQDTDVGYFWIKRSADQGFPQAMRAIEMM